MINENFSKDYIQAKREELCLELIKLVGISNFNEQKYITYQCLQSPETINRIKNMIPALRTVFPISRNRCLSINSWTKSKHPCVNLLRQILREVGYKLCLINDFQNNNNPDDKTFTKYIIIPLNNDKKPLENTDNSENNEVVNE